MSRFLLMARYPLIFVALGYGLLVIFVRPERRPPHPFFAGRDFHVIAHRGGADMAPESTLPVYRRAVDIGVDVLEVDVHSTADSALVVLHDRSVDRTTDGSGRVEQLTLAQLQALDAGYRWSADGATFPYRGAGLRIPTLAEMFEAFPGQRMLVETKSAGDYVARDLCATVRAYDMQDKVSVASFRGASLRAFRSACPEVVTSAGAGEVAWFLLLLRLRLDALYTADFDVFQVPETMRWLTIVDRRFIIRAHARNIPVQVWTVNKEEDMQRLVDLGVDGILTDRPDILLQVLREKGRR